MKINNHKNITFISCLLLISFLSVCFFGNLLLKSTYSLTLIIITGAMTLWTLSQFRHFEYEFDGNYIIINTSKVVRLRKPKKPQLFMPCDYIVHYSIIGNCWNQILILKFMTKRKKVKAKFRLSCLSNRQKNDITKSLDLLIKANLQSTEK